MYQCLTYKTWCSDCDVLMTCGLLIIQLSMEIQTVLRHINDLNELLQITCGDIVQVSHLTHSLTYRPLMFACLVYH